MRQLLAFTSVALLAVIACTTPPILAPRGDGWRCRPQEHSCGNGACCADGTACGGGPFNGCPQGMCCPVDEDGLVGGARPVPQTPASRCP